MNKHSHNKVVYKPYMMGQPNLLPADLEELIPADHLVRTVHQAIEQLDLSILHQQYKGGGTSSYHPVMMLKVLVYSYVEKLYSSRQIAKALRENVNFMWLSGQQQPDFRTINRFRGEVMKDIIGEVLKAGELVETPADSVAVMDAPSRPLSQKKVESMEGIENFRLLENRIAALETSMNALIREMRESRTQIDRLAQDVREHFTQQQKYIEEKREKRRENKKTILRTFPLSLFSRK